jgi:hypothetical protein
MSREPKAGDARYRIVFDNAKPESVFVRVVKNGVTVHSWRESRQTSLESGYPYETVKAMLDRAKSDARRWIKDDRELAKLLDEEGDGVER